MVLLASGRAAHRPKQQQQQQHQQQPSGSGRKFTSAWSAYGGGEDTLAGGVDLLYPVPQQVRLHCIGR